ncbi:LysM peptidoglycan-binding domain-containing protein [Tabrizicola sp.]|uniref:LysM peptidoglycan-binding domain-containing protein n=1 Tax=Tabrizicola sp. TaxID=2005166 RepID=UPI00286A827F|nr:LysM peptidoglycan-binding domain-containing protein [Tabrizicola sp.]
MSAWDALGAGGRATIVVLGAVGVSALGYIGWQLSQGGAPVQVPAETVVEAPADPSATAPAPADPAKEAVQPAAVAEAPSEPMAPVFDNWRVATDGEAVVSGLAAPGAKVAVLVDGTPVIEVEAAGSGEFAALFTLPPNDQPSLMSLTMTLPDGAIVPSDQTVALTAIAGPKLADVAAAAPAAATDEAPAEVEQPTAPAAILLTDEGAVVLQEPVAVDPVVVANVSLDTIAYTAAGAVQLGGRAQAGAFLRIYLDNAQIQTVLVPDTGSWLSTLNDTAPGIYTLRVDQVDDAGNVTSRFETPFKRETLEALAAVTAAEPAPTEPPAKAVAAEASQEPRVTEVAPEATTPEPLAEDAAEGEAVASTAATTEAPEVKPAQPDEIASTEVAKVAEPVAPPPAAPVTVTVQPGFTLWRIAEENFGTGVMYVQVFEANKDKIKDPDMIFPGQVFAIPAASGN